ncbi:chromatin assembly factor 1 subunit B [Tribolium castaneum]|uniref:Protein HIRA homolog-like Protein n=1 Tax=Tribolium castaneum TaxID=7070 RepID=D6W9X9_TRICA|nr:PREDICTED: chromatin assembly factor 1 subunit B [Tribolium castaneum]EEZ98093.1 Protein HIRA homolog-like Protein [Tribolium castaneum]|eukprot:XP_975277.1 PREDICTED: chromatin assembly factor 1 subunit B [Tribolium castaneum]
MKCSIPEISWHNREPVLSVHIQPVLEKFYRLATGGADCHVLIWQLTINENGSVKIEALSDLTRHQRAVNSVRWSPGGQQLATADDDANIIIWQLKTDNIPLLEGETNDKETWIVHKVMRGHKEDIYDLCWSPDGSKLLSGSIDNTAILWDFQKGKNEQILTDHKGFVQGVSWDPRGQFLATISTDRICRIFENTGKQVKARMHKGLLPVPEDHYLHNKEVKYFHDDTFKSFFRRLDFSPDGSLLAVPSGRIEIEDCKKILNCTLLFAVDNWGSPICLFPSGKQCSTVVRFCPILFELHEDGPDPLVSLPYRMVVAVGSDHDVILYDTQQLMPFAYFKDIHYTRLTDLTWSKDGQLLIASSTDGFCALITFEPNELGVEYIKEEEAEESVLEISGCEELPDHDETVEVNNPKKLNLLEQWAIKTPKKAKTEGDTSKRKPDEPNRLTPKRIKPIPVKDDENQKNTPATIKRKELPSPKASPLLNFLKPVSKEKIESPVSTPKISTVDLILDEAEARDGWRCDKDETVENKQTEPKLGDDEYTEEFSLHLEDTNSKSCVQENDQKEATENCVPKVEADKAATNTEDVKPKRRIPLITLSSPKTTKK